MDERAAALGGAPRDRASDEVFDRAKFGLVRPAGEENVAALLYCIEPTREPMPYVANARPVARQPDGIELGGLGGLDEVVHRFTRKPQPKSRVVSFVA